MAGHFLLPMKKCHADLSAIARRATAEAVAKAGRPTSATFCSALGRIYPRRRGDSIYFKVPDYSSEKQHGLSAWTAEGNGPDGVFESLLKRHGGHRLLHGRGVDAHGVESLPRPCICSGVTSRDLHGTIEDLFQNP